MRTTHTSSLPRPELSLGRFACGGLIAVLMILWFNPSWSQTNSDHPTYIVPEQHSQVLALPTGCQLLYNEGHAYIANSLYQKAYDTLKKFIETCPTFDQSWRAFSEMSGAVQYLASADTSLYLSYQRWLKSVLYLNKSDPEYFCACVEAIGGTFVYPSADSTTQQYWQSENRSLAVCQWLLQHTSCDTGMLRRDYIDTRNSQYATWLNDTTVKLDTTLPSMHDLGLDSLLNLHLGVKQQSPYATVLSSFSLSKNPLANTTNLTFNLDRTIYIRVEVYDELGRMIIGDGAGHSFDAGHHEITLDLSSYSTGAYYARISVGDGSVRTMKLVVQR